MKKEDCKRLNVSSIEFNNMETVVSDSDLTIEIDSYKAPERLTGNETFEDCNFKIHKKIIAFTWPCMLELFLISMVSIVNLIMVGHLGAYAISAVGITTQPVFICIAAYQALNIGSTALISRFVGAKDYESARIVVTQTLIISIISGITLSIVGFFFSHFIVSAMGAQADTIYYADLYMKYMSVGVIFQSIPTAVSALLRGAGYSRPSMRFNIVSNIVNAALGYIFIYGMWQIPGMGVKGAGIASTIAKIVACIMSIYTILGQRHTLKITPGELLNINTNMMKRILRVGLGAVGEQLVLRIGILVFTMIVTGLGTIPFAAHQIGISIIGFTYNISQPFGIASSSFVGRSLGAGKYEMAEEYTSKIRKIGFTASIIISILIFIFSKPIVSLYTNDPYVIVFADTVLKIIAVIMPAQSSQLILTGSLRGAGDSKWPLISTICGTLLIRMILGAVFVKIFSWGLTGAWVAVAIDQYVRSLVIYLRYKYGNWQHISI
ncbi:MAG: MATE family efflux transporter [Bacillota bacterium]|nr:MATE family efflux transporter [Bacillota bacterium]